MKRSAIKRTVGLQRTGRIRPVSPKRAQQKRTYNQLRKQFLDAHPFCQVFLKEGNHDEMEAIRRGYVLVWIKGAGGAEIPHEIVPPRATEIHHVAKRRGVMLNDTKHWLAVSRKWHDQIESNKAWARARGYLENF